MLRALILSIKRAMLPRTCENSCAMEISLLEPEENHDFPALSKLKKVYVTKESCTQHKKAVGEQSYAEFKGRDSRFGIRIEN